jgi:diguanylate cyclase (GGDEF)-like protein
MMRPVHGETDTSTAQPLAEANVQRSVRRVAVLEAVLKAHLELGQASSISDLADGLLARVMAVFQATASGLYLVQAGELRLITDRGDEFEPVLALGHSLSGSVAKNSRAILSQDHHLSPYHFKDHPGSVWLCAMSTPILKDDQVVGVLTVGDSQQSHRFDATDLEDLQRFAEVAGTALTNTALLESAQRAERRARSQAQQLELLHQASLAITKHAPHKVLLHSVLERAAALLEADAGAVYLLHGDTELELVSQLHVLHHQRVLIERNSGISGQVVETGQAMKVDDFQAWLGKPANELPPLWYSALSAPLSMGGRVIGALTLAHTQALGHFNDEDLLTLQRFAGVANVALENTELFDASQASERRARQQSALLEALNQTSLELTGMLAPEALLQQLIDRVSKLFSADAGAVYLRVGTERFERAAVYGQSPSLDGLVGRGLSGRVMAIGRGLLVEDYQTWGGRDIRPDEMSTWRSALSVPLMRGHAVIGALTIADTKNANRFSSTDLDMLTRFSTVASAALEKLRLLEDAHRAEGAALARAEQLEALTAISLDVLSQRDFLEVLERSLELLLPLIGAKLGGYWQVLPERNALRLVIAMGTPEAVALIGTERASDDDSGIAELHPLFIENYSDLLERFQDQPDQMRSTIRMPIKFGHDVHGVFVLAKAYSEPFSQQQLDTVRRFAALASVALENARLIEDTKRAELRTSSRNALLEVLHQINLELGEYMQLEPLLQLLLERAVHLVGAQSGRLYLRDHGSTRLRHAATIGTAIIETVDVGSGTTGLAAQRGAPVVIDDYGQWEQRIIFDGQWRSVMSIPLKRGDEVLGVITVAHHEEVGRFGADEIQLLERLAVIASLAIEKAQLLEDATLAEVDALERARQIEALYQISLEVSSQLEPETLLNGILERSMGLLNTDAGGVYLLHGDGTEAVLAASIGGFPVQKLSLGVGASGHVMKSGAPVLLDDYQTWSGRYPVGKSSWRSVASVPLRQGQRIIGALTLANTSETGRFRPRDLDTLERFATLASIALENSRLYTSERLNLRDERLRARIALVVAKLRSVPELAQAVIEVLRDTLSYRCISLYRLEDQTLKLQAQVGASAMLREIDTATGINGRVVRTQKAELVVDGRNDLDFILDDPELLSIVCAPLIGSEGVLGTLNIESDLEHPLGPQDLEMLRALAGPISTALENALLHERLERRAAEMEFLRFQAERAARFDPLTNLRNRRAFEEDFSRALERYKLEDRGFHLAVLDLTGFKQVNDHFGHAAGDAALARVAKVLASDPNPNARAEHKAYRIGGDEFALIIPVHLDHPDHVRTVIHHVIQGINALQFEGDMRISSNIGCAAYPTDANDPDKLKSLADTRMYAAKAAHRPILEGDDLIDPPVPRRRAND